MKSVNWSNLEKSTKLAKKQVKNIQLVSEYLKNLPEKGKMLDNISKNVVEIKDCKSSSLRRYIKLLDNYYYIVNTEKDRNMILSKKIEIETELNGREDGISL